MQRIEYMVESNTIIISVLQTTVENAYIQASSTTVTLNDDITIQGYGFTPGASIDLDDSLGGISLHMADSTGYFDTGDFSIASVTQSAGTIEFWAIDTSTNYTTPKISITVTASTTTTSTTASGDPLPPSEWTGTGAYGSNTNPVAFGNWATCAGINFYGAGYYVNSAGTEEMYASDVSTLQSYLESIDYCPTTNTQVGTLKASPTSVSEGGSITFDISGLTPSGAFYLLIQGGVYLTQSYALSSSGSATLVYDVTAGSPLYADLINSSSGVTILAEDNTGKTTNTVTITLA